LIEAMALLSESFAVTTMTGRLGCATGGFPQQVEPFAVGQAEVEQQDVGLMLGDHCRPWRPVKAAVGGEAAALENGGKRGLDVALVVDNADQGFGTHVSAQGEQAFAIGRPMIRKREIVRAENVHGTTTKT
jgi:hypothetical protein